MANSVGSRKLFAAPKGYDNAILYNLASLILIPSLVLFVILGFRTLYNIFWADFVNPKDTGGEISTTVVHNTPWLLLATVGIFIARILLSKARKKQ